MKKDVMLSVIIISYNQEKYIKEAIDSVINQKTEYSYEILLADDCSPDNTKKILEEYGKKYPELIKILPRPKNLGANNNIMDAYLNSKGKYIAILEGDDYWCDENKIQIQVDFLEENPEYIAISHRQEGRDNKKNVLGYFPKNIKADMTIDGMDDLLKNGKSFSCTATMHRNLFLDSKHVKDLEYLHSLDTTISDAQMCKYLSTLGKIYVMKKPMMVYRIRNNDGNSNFNSSHKVNEIEYRYLKIYNKEYEFYNRKYDFYNKIKKSYTLGVAYNICKLNFKDIKKFNDECPKEYKIKIWLSFPFTCLKILSNRFFRDRSDN